LNHKTDKRKEEGKRLMTRQGLVANDCESGQFLPPPQKFCFTWDSFFQGAFQRTRF